MSHRTKIVCTMGPSVDDPDKIRALIRAGMNGARLNFSHGSHEDHANRIANLKAIREQMQVPLAIIVDTKGPEVRLGKLLGDMPITLSTSLKLVTQEAYDSHPEGNLPINPYEVVSQLHDGSKVLIDDGYLSACIEKKGEATSLRFLNTGLLKSRKSLNVPGGKLNLPAITQKDRDDMLFAIEHDLDWIAASFIRSASHVLEIKKFLKEHGGHEILVAAKIENQEGVDQFDAILEVSDGIMVARGDLGVEVPLAQVPRLQKMMIRKANLAGKPVVTATQMLESMIQNPRPTRAEVSDVANAIYDSSSAVMLSGETAVGKYPIETVQIMREIAEEAESDFDYRRFFMANSEMNCTDLTASIAMASVKTAFSSEAKAIMCFTQSGHTAQLISRYRPSMRIIANTTQARVYHQLALSWGVDPVLMKPSSCISEGFAQLCDIARTRGWLQGGDLVLVTTGNPFGQEGNTNVMMLEHVPLADVKRIAT